MVNVAVITHYYRCNNYGGCLQAYALCAALKDMGHNAEQLCYDRSADKINNDSALRKCLRAAKKEYKKIKNHKVKKILRDREKCMLSFTENKIPHSSEVYNADTITKAAECYDAFITGSDQVWNPSAYCSAYGLDFVPSDKVKLSYAASIARDSLSDEQTAVLAKSIKDFTAVSVREPQAKHLLANSFSGEISVTLDPTLLLNKSRWDELAGKRITDSPYLFCFFLGGDPRHREAAKRHADKHGLKIVTIPYVSGKYFDCDLNFGDIAPAAVSPEDFISMIKYSEEVFTDSFHAVAFSVIYEKPFVAFDRSINGSMGSRIRSLTSLIGMEERFCASDEQVNDDYIDGLPLPNYEEAGLRLEEKREESLGFLREAIIGEK